MTYTSVEEKKAVLAKYLPVEAVGRIWDFLDRNKVQLKITQSRRTKLGDYSWAQHGRTFDRITVNGDLNPFRFLEVMLHEMAHHSVFHRYGAEVQPHGYEWQREYVNLLREYEDCFPAEALPQLVHYTSRLPLNRESGKAFEEAICRCDPGYVPYAERLLLNNLQAGDAFRLKNDGRRCFRAIERRRTLWKCEEVATHKIFLVRGDAEVECV